MVVGDAPATRHVVRIERHPPLRGRVLDADGAPIAGIAVSASGARVVDLGPDGSFELHDLAPGTVTVWVHPPWARAIRTRVSFTGKADAEPLLIRLPRPGRVLFEVIDAGGRPATGALIHVRDAADEAAADLRPDDAGVARHDELAPGRYAAIAYRGTSRSVPTPVEIRPGEETRARLVLIPAGR